MKLKKMLTVLCVAALLAVFLGVTAFAVEAKPFNATFNGYAGTQSFSWGEKVKVPTRSAYINVTGYSASSGGTSVGFTCTCGGTSAYTVFYATGVQYPQYPVTPGAYSAATLTVRASTNIIGVGGLWGPQVQS